jgi:hypothetical protein
MDTAVLAEYGVAAAGAAAASVGGYDLVIGPRVNLVRSPWGRAYGAVVAVTHDDLAGLYTGLEQQYGIRYVPEAVLAQTRDGQHAAAQCYIAHEMEPGEPDAAYVRQLAGCIRALGLPEWYAAHVESFARHGRST